MASSKKRATSNPRVPEPPTAAGPERDACQRCGLFRTCRRPFMPAEVPRGWTRRLLLVGEAPGRDEDERTGRPFTGLAGRLLRNALAEAAFRPEDVAFTNAVRCRPPGNATPTMGQIRWCRPLLLGELAALQPQVVLGLGTTAARALTDHGGAVVTRLRGRRLTVPGWQP